MKRLFVITLLSLSACFTIRKGHEKPTGPVVEDVDAATATAPPLYLAALAQLNHGDNEASLQGFESFVLQAPSSPYSQAANYNAGRALEALGRYSEAAGRYRAVVETTEAAAPHLQALALYRLSFCNEALGDEDSTIAVLHDLLSRREFLPPEIAAAELPARLAAAYARAGAFDSAVDYYKIAEAGITRLRGEGGLAKVPDWLARTLFEMGSRPITNLGWNDFEVAFRPLVRGQLYLLEAADLNLQPWADRAADNLIALYQALETSLLTWPERVDVAATRTSQELQWQRAALLLDSLQELTARKLPIPGQTLATQKIFEFADALRKKIEVLLVARPAGEGLTNEALLRQSAVRGRVVAPSDALEREFLESSKHKSLPAKKSSNEEKVDPNL